VVHIYREVTSALQTQPEIAAPTISEKIQTFCSRMVSEHHRYRSWEHCYNYFQSTSRREIVANRDHAALQLGFYLASWGMYRGSSFLLQHTYTIHKSVIDQLLEARFSILWETEFGTGQNDRDLIPIVLELIDAIREAYSPFVLSGETSQPTDTLVTKVLLGTLGTLPACDRYFIDGFKSSGLSYSYLNGNFIERLLQFCRNNLTDLRSEQMRIAQSNYVRYPLMKLVDMYFWELGFERDGIGSN
jgi:hypothetical protein